MPPRTVLYTNFKLSGVRLLHRPANSASARTRSRFLQDLSRQMPVDGILIAYKDLNEDPRVEWLDSNPHFRRFKEFPSLLVYEYRVRADAFDQRESNGGTFAPVGA